MKQINQRNCGRNGTAELVRASLQIDNALVAMLASVTVAFRAFEFDWLCFRSHVSTFRVSAVTTQPTRSKKRRNP